MIRGSFMNPPTGVLPFEMFRTFAPVFDQNWPLTAWTPPCDIYETDKEIVLKMDLPEVRKEHVQVTIKNHVLTLRGERKFEQTVNRENYRRIERSYGEFTRSFTLPVIVEGDNFVAEFKESVLTVMLPKREEAKAKQIDVKAN
jgi:HSP20 family protein